MNFFQKSKSELFLLARQPHLAHLAAQPTLQTSSSKLVTRAELDMSDALPSAFQGSLIALAINRILRGILRGAATIATFLKSVPREFKLI